MVRRLIKTWQRFLVSRLLISLFFFKLTKSNVLNYSILSSTISTWVGCVSVDSYKCWSETFPRALHSYSDSWFGTVKHGPWLILILSSRKISRLLRIELYGFSLRLAGHSWRTSVYFRFVLPYSLHSTLHGILDHCKIVYLDINSKRVEVLPHARWFEDPPSLCTFRFFFQKMNKSISMVQFSVGRPCPVSACSPNRHILLNCIWGE